MHKVGEGILSLLDAEELRSEPFADLPFVEFCERWVRIQDKHGKIIPLVLNRTQLDLVVLLEQWDRIVVLKARQEGVTTVVELWHYYQVCRGNAKTSTICHDSELTAEIREMVDRCHNNIPEAYQPKRKFANAKVTTYPDLSSQTRIATVGGHAGKLSAGKKKGRGGTNTHILGTEVAFWADAESVMSAAMQAGNPHIILESTPNGAQGFFYETCMRALDGKGEWVLAFYPWWWSGDYQMPLSEGEALTYSPDEQALVDREQLTPEQIKWRRKKQDELKEKFLQEYPEDPKSCFLLSGRGYFRAVLSEKNIFTAPEAVTPVTEHRHVGGLDWGQDNDFTAFSIIDSVTGEERHLYRLNKRSWAEMRADICDLCEVWGVEAIVAENNAMGSSQIESLGTELQKRNLKTHITPFTMTNPSKDSAIRAFRSSLENGNLRLLPDENGERELQAVQAKQLPSGLWSYGAPEPEHDDTVIARMLAWHGVSSAIDFNKINFLSG